jgi:hypothetical protein
MSYTGKKKACFASSLASDRTKCLGCSTSSASIWYKCDDKFLCEQCFKKFVCTTINCNHLRLAGFLVCAQCRRPQKQTTDQDVRHLGFCVCLLFFCYILVFCNLLYIREILAMWTRRISLKNESANRRDHDIFRLTLTRNGCGCSNNLF